MSVCARVFAFVAVGSVLIACSDLPVKAEALATIQSEVKEEATCTLPINLLPLLKMQHTSKAVCVPREVDPAGKKTFDDTLKCLDALVAAGITKRMPDSYMAEWPDELQGTGFDSVSPYERRARTLLFKDCVSMGAGNSLRAGQFRCGQAKADKILHETKKDDTHVNVSYSRVMTLDSSLASIDAACGAVTRPGPDASQMFEKQADKKWHMIAEGTMAGDAGL